MKRKDLICRLLAHFPELRKRDLEGLVEAFFEEMTRALVRGERIEIRGFGRFEVHHGKERVFVNPQNKETYYLRGNRRLVFKVGKDLFERVNTPPRAVLDLGTQTFRLALGKLEADGLRVIERRRVNVRLGEGLEKGIISPPALERGLAALKEFRNYLYDLGVSEIKAVGTAVFREAANAGEFMEASRKLGFHIEVISPERESELVLKGVQAGLSPDGPFLLADVGGGSTELSLVKEGRKIWEVSIPLGAVRLKEGFIRAYPLTPQEFRGIRGHVARILSELEIPEEVSLLVGCGGSASLLAALDLRLTTYLPERIHGHRVSLSRIETITEHLRGLPLSRIRRLRGMEPGREDIALPGLLIFQELLRKAGISELVISEWGLLEGLLLSF
ncbi:HU family DNA-binding protein [Thermosulfurimonas sp. F29]|uniref:Ppx/GppA phosphatase family protein n=1 Tax=Thermosulfurimonas sp. F29 TaxID=2867247 RepID=UPI001C832B2D|nr:HU family DNA-binding protein [Thermosulfurimonas sp. F29]MBX6422965.1 HU family DNA-binding protein [Thermosulfurimonas sp. F29]